MKLSAASAAQRIAREAPSISGCVEIGKEKNVLLPFFDVSGGNDLKHKKSFEFGIEELAARAQRGMRELAGFCLASRKAWSFTERVFAIDDFSGGLNDAQDLDGKAFAGL